MLTWYFVEIQEKPLDIARVQWYYLTCAERAHQMRKHRLRT
jgi:hypothetical protein